MEINKINQANLIYYCGYPLLLLRVDLTAPVPNRAEIRTAQSSPEDQSTHSHEWFGHDLQVLLVKLEQILHFKL